MKLRLGVVGLGSAWQSRYVPALRALNERFEVRAVFEPVFHLGQQAARPFGARVEDGFRSLASREDIDAVLVLSSQWHGWLPVLAASDAGKAVYCAEPLDVSPQEAVRIRDRIDRSGVAFVAELPRRHAPATQRLQELIATHLGSPKLLFCHRRRSADEGHISLNGGSNLRELTESIDWCCHIVGRRPRAVTGISHESGQAAVLDYQMMSLDFSDPARPGSETVAQISCGRYIPREWPEAISFRPPADLQIACTKGIAFIDLPATLIWFDRAGRHMETLECERPIDELLLTQFHRCVTRLVRDPSNLDDAFRAYWIATQAAKSQREGRRVPLDECQG
jgi:predicted dehydrogenase